MDIFGGDGLMACIIACCENCLFYEDGICGFLKAPTEYNQVCAAWEHKKKVEE